MARQATIIDTVPDTWGDLWDVREYRATVHGFAVALGWPYAVPRGPGGGGIRTIVTEPLAAHFEVHRRHPQYLNLPIGKGAVTRIRRLLGHHRQIDAASWWDARIDDLSDLTLDQFAIRHSVSTASAALARHALFGHKLRPAGWWRQDDVAAILLKDAPRSEIADALAISIGSVGRLRHMLKSLDLQGDALS